MRTNDKYEISKEAYPQVSKKHRGKTENILIGICIIFLIIFLVIPLVSVFGYALREGIPVFVRAVTDSAALSALRLTLITAVAAVLVNTAFALCAAWVLTRYSFKGSTFLSTLIDLPFAVSPVIAGLALVLTYGRRGFLHPLLHQLNIQIVFSEAGVILAVIFVTFPYVLRELLPVLYASGRSEEEAAALMGAKGFTIFLRITFPKLKWSLLYGIVLCSARALGEFGAVSVISGHLKGYTNTLPLEIEGLYKGFELSSAFAVSTLLIGLSILILAAKTFAERKGRKAGER